MPSGPVQCFGAQEQDYRIRFLYPGQVFERLRSLFLFRGNARQLQVSIGMEGIDVEQPLEMSLSLGCLTAGEIMVARIVQERRGRRPVRQGSLI